MSKYRKIILKLEGLNDFQKVRGFLRGLNDEYKTKVKTQYPKTLEDARKSAHIFYDSFDKPSATHAWGKNGSQTNKNGKRRIDHSSKEDASKENNMMPKGPLSSDELARVSRDKVCFQCLGSHERKDCPQFKGNVPDKNKGKEKVMHMVQLLLLEDCSKYSVVQVCHQAIEHECCLTVSPWQSTFGSNDLFLFSWHHQRTTSLCAS